MTSNWYSKPYKCSVCANDLSHVLCSILIKWYSIHYFIHKGNIHHFSQLSINVYRTLRWLWHFSFYLGLECSLGYYHSIQFHPISQGTLSIPKCNYFPWYKKGGIAIKHSMTCRAFSLPMWGIIHSTYLPYLLWNNRKKWEWHIYYSRKYCTKYIRILTVIYPLGLSSIWGSLYPTPSLGWKNVTYVTDRFTYHRVF